MDIHAVIAVVRSFTGVRSALYPETRIGHDLGVTGDDGEDLLQRTFERFGIDVEDERWDFREVFGLRQNECLFDGESGGCLLLDVPAIWRRLRGKPPWVVTDLTIGELHAALLRARGRRTG